MRRSGPWIKMVLLGIKVVLLGLAGVLLGGPAGNTRPLLDPSPYDVVTARADWRSTDRTVTFSVLGRSGEPRGRAVAIYEDRGQGPRRIVLDRDRGFSPWAVAAVELDGDSLPELAVAVFKPTRYDPRPANRLFIYDFTGENMFPRWLGSRLAWPFEDFIFTPGPDGLDRLLTVEHQGRERLVLRRYRWNGFGFTPEADLVRIQDPPDYEQSRDRLAARMRQESTKGVQP